MTQEALEEYKKFQTTQGKAIARVYTETIADVYEKYGSDTAIGYALAMNIIYTALTGNDLKDEVEELYFKEK